MAPYKLTIAYDGTNYSGFQRQKNNRTIQGEIEKALRRIGWRGNSILSAGRTDSGVHADGQVIAFTLNWAHCPLDLARALNDHLPADISVKSAEVAAESFHPRFAAKARKYRYQCVFLPHREPILERFSWRVWPLPDQQLLQASAEVLQGEHDFYEFGKPPKADGSTNRTIFSADWEFENNHQASFAISSEAYLYHMVRRIVFLLIRIGQRRLDAKELERSFERQGKLPAGIAPAHGLFLEEVNY